MNLITKVVFTLFLCASIQFISAQEFTLDFSNTAVDCAASTVCYDVTAAANSANFGLGSYNLRLFYDASKVSYVNGSPNVSSLPGTYSIGSIQNAVADVSAPQFGSLAYDATLGFLEVGVDYTPSTPQTLTGAPANILQNLCFDIIDATVLSDASSCFELIWVNETSRENYTNAVTTLNNATSGATADLAASTYNNLTSSNNCLIDACIADPCIPIVDADGDGVCDVGPNPDSDPQNPCVPNPNSLACQNSMVVYELGFTNGALDCNAETVCYDIFISAPDDFDLGSYNLRIFYDADLLDLIDTSPNLSPGSALDAGYNINSVNDMQGGDQSANGSLPFDDNLDIIDIAVDYLGSNPIVATGNPSIIIHDLCFDILDQALISDPTACIHAVWVTNASEENYTVGETTVNVAGNIGVTTDIDNSVYNDLEPTGAQCLENACLTAIPTMGEWGLICLSLILLIFGVVTIRETVPNLSKA